MPSTITEEEYQELKQKMISEFNRLSNRTKNGCPVTNIILTCDDCPHRFTCEFAGDLYNMDGDCLAEK